jgi:hypothetical protein
MRSYGIYQPAQCHRAIPARIWKPCLVVAAVLLAALAGSAWSSRQSDALAAPQHARCWQIEGPELEGYTPAHEIEIDILHAMQHQSAISLKCSGDINGRLVKWTATQIWIARGIPTVHPTCSG